MRNMIPDGCLKIIVKNQILAYSCFRLIIGLGDCILSNEDYHKLWKEKIYQ